MPGGDVTSIGDAVRAAAERLRAEWPVLSSRKGDLRTLQDSVG